MLYFMAAGQGNLVSCSPVLQPVGLQSTGHNLATEDHFLFSLYKKMGLPCSSNGKQSACNSGDQGSFPGSGRSSGEGIGKPLQHSCLENPIDRGAWWATVCGVAKNQTRLSN